MPARPRPRDPQAYLFGSWAFSIAAARDILAAAPRPPASLPVGPWARAFSFDLGPGHASLLGPGPGFDAAYALTTDLAEPVLVATITAAGEELPLLIDGTHRLYKAHATGTATLPALVLTAAETLGIRRRVRPGTARLPGTGRSRP
jgi:hypothetical protein